MSENAKVHAVQSPTQAAPVSKGMLWTGRVMSALPVLALVPSAAGKLVKPQAVVEGFSHLGLPETLARGLGLLEIACTVVYLIPRT